MTDDPTAADQPESVGIQQQREQIKRLEKELAASQQTAKANADAARELAFLRAGVDPDRPGAKYFIRGYDGDLTPEAIKAEAEREGFLRTEAPPAPAPQQQPAPSDQGMTAIGHTGVDEAAVAAQGFAAISQATVDPQVSTGVNHVEKMRLAAEAAYKTGGAKGAVDAVTAYMQTNNLPTAEGATVDRPL